MEKYLDLARKVLNKLTLAGADAAQCLVYANECDEVQAEARTFNLMRSYTGTKLTLTAVKGLKTSEFSVNRFDDASVGSAVKSCMEALDYAADDEHAGIAEFVRNERFRRGVFNPDMDVLTARLVEYARDIEREYPNVVFECGGSYNHIHRAYVNTNGVEFTDETGAYRVFTGYTAMKGSQTTSFGPGSSLLLTDPDVHIIDADDNREQIERAIALLDPRPIGDKFTGTLIATPGYAGSFFYSLMQIALVDNPVTSGTGKFCGKIGLRVADPRVTLSFAPFSEDIRMGERFTDEGYAATDCAPIEKGVLKGFMLSRHGAAKAGLPRRANSGGSMCVSPGDAALSDIIAGTERGILMGRYSGTEPDVSGELSGVAKNSFYIENGKVMFPIVETMMSANMFGMLKNVRAVSRETRRNGSGVLPYVAFDGVTIK